MCRVRVRVNPSGVSKESGLLIVPSLLLFQTIPIGFFHRLTHLSHLLVDYVEGLGISSRSYIRAFPLLLLGEPETFKCTENALLRASKQGTESGSGFIAIVGQD